MKILLLNLPFKEEQFFEKNYFGGSGQAPLFPFGIGYLTSYLKKHGHDVSIIDIYSEQLNYVDVVKKIRELDFDVVGISALVTQYAYLRFIAGEIKKIRKVPVVLGNGLATACFKTVLTHVPEVDICVLGEGEQTFRELLEKGFADLQNIRGIAFRKKFRDYEDRGEGAFSKSRRTSFSFLRSV